MQACFEVAADKEKLAYAGFLFPLACGQMHTDTVDCCTEPAQWRIKMRRMDIADATDAVTGMLALRAVLTEELDNVETSIQAIADSEHARSDASREELSVCFVARAALYSGLAGINELLGWINLLTEKDAEGNAFDMTRLLPAMPAWSIN
jgi:hypothetical protein